MHTYMGRAEAPMDLIERAARQHCRAAVDRGRVVVIVVATDVFGVFDDLPTNTHGGSLSRA